MPVTHVLANKLHLADVMMLIDRLGDNISKVDMPDNCVEGRAQGIRANMRELDCQGGSEGNCCLLLHFFDPNHDDGSATIMQGACRRNCSGFNVGAFVRHGNVTDNALVDQLRNGRRVRLGQQGVGPCTWRVGMRPIAALIQQLRQRAPGGASYTPRLLYGGAGTWAF